MDAWLIFVIAAATFYFLPTVIAFLRGNANTFAIFVVNLLLGWTFVGWVVALVWSLTAEQRRPSRFD